MSRIIIENNKAKMVREIIEKEVALDDFLEQVIRGQSFVVPFLPAGCLGFSSLGEHSVFIVEQAPRTQYIGFIMNREVCNFKIHLPYFYFGVMVKNNPICVQQVGIWMSKKRILRENSQVGHFIMPNVSIEDRNVGLLCVGDMTLSENVYIHQFVDELIAQFWGSYFNHDHFRETDSGIPIILNRLKTVDNGFLASKFEETKNVKYKNAIGSPQVRYLVAWELLTEEMTNEEFVNQIEFRKTFTYKECLEELGEYFSEL